MNCCTKDNYWRRPPKIYDETVIIPKEMVLNKEYVTLKFVNKSEMDILVKGHLRSKK